MNKLLILVRHAHRDTSAREVDNGLSGKGRLQAHEFYNVWKKHWAKAARAKGFVLLSSPKKRCIETLEKVSEKEGAPIRVNPLLDEQAPSETHAALLKRILEFQDWWKKEAPPVTVACSHGDWLPICAEILSGREIQFEKGAWVAVESDSSGISVATPSG